MLDLCVQLSRLREKAQARQATSPVKVPMSLAERIERLRVPNGAVGEPSDEALAGQLGGTVVAQRLVERSQALPLPWRHGAVSIAGGAPLASAARSVGRLAEAVAPESLLFLDTETTGLAGGAGTAAFMCGLAWIECDALRLAQWTLAGFVGEGALLERVHARIACARVIVTFNGKSFDLPLLKTRGRLVGREFAVDGIPHVDLLHVSRRLLQSGWPDCRLRTAEAAALRLERVNDLTGAEAPAAWRRWLERGDAGQLARVLEHNR